MKNLLIQVGALLDRAYKNWRHDGAPQIAAAMSYYTLLAIAPLLVVIVTVIGRIVGRYTVYEQVLTQAETLAGPLGADLARELMSSAQLPTTGTIISAVAIFLAIFGATRVFGQLRIAFDRVWNIRPEPPEEGLPFWQSIRHGLLDVAEHNLKAFSMVIVVGGLLIASLGLSAAVTFAADRLSPVVTLTTTTLRTIDYIGSTLLVTVLFAAVYRFLPRTRISWKDVWIGSLMTSGLFTVGRWLLGLYFANASPGSAFGAAGSLVVFLVWVNYSSQLMLFGAELTQAWTYLHGSRRGEDAGD